QPDQQSRVSIQFEVSDAGTSTKGRPAMKPTVYRYEVAATTTHVIHEKLSAKTSRTFTRIYERILDGEEYQFKGIAKRYSVNMPKNASMIAWLARQQLETAQAIQNFFSTITVHSSALFGRLPPLVSAFNAIDIYRNTPVIKSHMVEMLKAWDLGIDDV